MGSPFRTIPFTPATTPLTTANSATTIFSRSSVPTATDRKLSIKPWERTLMFCTFVVMGAIELSLLIDKPNARYFAVTVLAVGLILRGLVQERRAKKEAAEKLPIQAEPIKLA